MRSSPWIFAWVVALAGAACHMLPIPALHSRSATLVAGRERFDTPIAVVILPPAVDAFRMSKGAGRLSETRSRAAAECIAGVLRDRVQAARFELHELRELDEEHLARIREHVGLCGVVAPLLAAQAPIAGSDHTLGPGLAFLAERTGADAALIVNGEEIGAGIDSEDGPSAALGLSLVDLRTGRLLWVAQASSHNAFDPPSLGSEDDVEELVGRVLQHYPRPAASPEERSTTAGGGDE